MPERLSQQQKAELLYQLHHSGKLLVLPNIWDCLGALLLEKLEFPAIATASAALAWTGGYNDGENIPFPDLLAILSRIVASVNLPVTADIESGFADNESQLEENVHRLLDTGVVGINFEDSDKKTNELIPVEVQCRRIASIKKVAYERAIPLFVNARTDVYIRGKGLETPRLKLEEAVKRGTAYKKAGADCFFPLGVTDGQDIKTIVDVLQMPINILLLPGVPAMDLLQEIGVRRISLGPGFLKIAIQAMKRTALKLQKHEGLEDIARNEITSDYITTLINRH